MGAKVKGNLIIIGGAEDKEGDCLILKKVVELSGGEKARIVVMTTAAENPRELGEVYDRLFKRLGVGEVDVIDIDCRERANNRALVDIIASSTGIFFTGGDQLRITSILGGTMIDEAIRQAYLKGTVIVGTSAGASVMSETMIVEGDSDNTPKRCTLKMAPGMGWIKEVVIDQHFAQRGRLGRLLSAVAQNPYILGLGIDEDTAIVLDDEAKFEVIGSHTVTVADGVHIQHSNVSESRPDEPLALTYVTLHILPSGYGFDLKTRCPITAKAERAAGKEDKK